MGDGLPEAQTNLALGSLQHAKNLIRLLYKKEGFAFDGLLGEPITTEFGDDITKSKFASMFCFLDEVIAIFHNLNLAMIGTIASKVPDAAFNYRLSNSALQALCAIRMLLGKGLDLEARVQLRAFRELMVAWLYFDKFPDKRSAFSAPTTLKEANHFWYINLRYVEKTLKGVADKNDFHPHMDDKLIVIEKMLDTAAHPSWMGMNSSATTSWHNPSDGVVFQPITNASIFSLSTALTFAMFGYGPLKEVQFAIPQGLANLFPKHTASDDPNIMLGHLQKMPALLFLFSCKFSETLSDPAGAPAMPEER